MRLDYELTEEESTRIGQLASSSSTSQALRSRANVVGSVVAVVLLGAAFLVTDYVSGKYLGEIASDISLVKWAWLAAMAGGYISIMVAGRAQSAVIESGKPSYPIKTGVAIEAHGLVIEDGAVQVHIFWPQVSLAEERGRDAVIFWKRGVVAIPESAFASDLARTQFVSEVNRRASL